MKKNSLHRVRLRFTRWSRKNYAAFCSIGCCVSIGHLHNNIIEKALLKQAKRLLPESVFCAESTVGSEETDEWESPKELSNGLLCPCIITAVHSSDCPAAFFAKHYINHTKVYSSFQEECTFFIPILL